MKNELLNLKKKLIAYSIATGIGVTSLTGCATNDLPDGGKINYEYISENSNYMHFLTLKYGDDSEKTFIVEESSNLFTDGASFTDIKLDEEVLKTQDGRPISSIIIDYNYDKSLTIKDFLLKEDNIKEEYTSDDIDQIIKDYEEYLKNSNKVLVK